MLDVVSSQSYSKENLAVDSSWNVGKLKFGSFDNTQCGHTYNFCCERPELSSDLEICYNGIKQAVNVGKLKGSGSSGWSTGTWSANFFVSGGGKLKLEVTITVYDDDMADYGDFTLQLFKNKKKKKEVTIPMTMYFQDMSIVSNANCNSDVTWKACIKRVGSSGKLCRKIKLKEKLTIPSGTVGLK